MWIMYIVWLFNPGNDHRVAAYALQEQCEAVKVEALKDSRVKSVRCIFVQNSAFTQN